VTILKNKEIGDQIEREANQRKLDQLRQNKAEIQKQIDDAALMR